MEKRTFYRYQTLKSNNTKKCNSNTRWVIASYLRRSSLAAAALKSGTVRHGSRVCSTTGNARPSSDSSRCRTVFTSVLTGTRSPSASISYLAK